MATRRQQWVNERGMTLIEIMVVVAIIGLVMGAVSFRLYNKFIEQQINISEQAVVQAKNFFTSYQLTHRECPESLQDLVDDGIVDDEPHDAWGEPLLFVCPAEKGVGVADIWSKGKDGIDGTGDDICSWKIKRRRSKLSKAAEVNQ